ncbi:MAG TPA: hypothetical protein VK689_13640 [Armatimonadota bacterium]|nr:hypothetical protein [Armatimonadota bacterium]
MSEMGQVRRLKIPKPHDLAGLLDTLPAGRRRVAEALVAGEGAPTYPEVAEALGVHLGTVHTHLRRLQQLHPEVYGAIMGERARQLAERHEGALSRAADHSREWHRKERNRRYYYRYGFWPWEWRRTRR